MYILRLVKEWTKENLVTVFVMGLILYQKFLEIYPNTFPKFILYNSYFPYVIYPIFGILSFKFIRSTLKTSKKYKSSSAIRPHDRQVYQFVYNGIIKWFHLFYDWSSIIFFMMYLYPLVAGSVSEDLRKAMIFADFYGLVIVPYIVSLNFGIKKMKR